MNEASRLAATYGGEFEVFVRVASAIADKMEAELANAIAESISGEEIHHG